MRQYLICLQVTHYLFVFLIVFLFAAIIPTLTDAMYVYRTVNGSLERYVRKAGDKVEVCNNDDCKAVAKRLKAMMDFSTDPCQDFYQFTCGKFLELEIPASLGALSTFTFLKNIVAKRIKQNLENPIDSSTDPLFVRNAKNLYILCKNSNQREKDGSLFLNKLLERLGGWPVIVGDNWDEDNFSWMDLLNKFRNYGLDTNYLFTLTIGVNLKNSSLRMIEIDGAETILDGRQIDEDIKGSRFTKAYHNLMLNIAQLLGADKTKVDDELWEVVTLEAALAKSKYLSVNSKEFLTWTLNELTKKNEQIPWKKFITELFLNYSVTITDDEPISIQNEGFLKSINGLLPGAPNRVMANYLIWRSILSLITELPSKFLDVYTKFQEEAFDIKATSEPWIHCIATVSELYGFVLSYQYVKNYFDDEAKKQAEELVGDIKREVTQSLIWLDQSSQEEAIKKLNIMEAYVGYPEELVGREESTGFLWRCCN
uniref:Putative peptidase family m13 n=1 Tax=Panstrongylus lignarius TaxID=156445 RepID=A0A224XMZ9_9HEMI